MKALDLPHFPTFPTFKDATLLISLRSPFARRIRLALLENQIPYQEKVLDVFKPTQELIALNPLSRVPVLQLKSGEVIIDSNLILQLFYQYETTLLKPQSPSEEIQVAYWSALGAGLCEKTVEYFLNSICPESQQDPELKAELEAISNRLFNQIETHLKSGKKNYLVGSRLTQSDLDVCTALTYFSLRFSEHWKKEYPLTAQYLDILEKRAAFQKTAPPK